MNVNMFLNIILLKLHNGLPSDSSRLNVHVQGFRDMSFSDSNETKSYLRILSNIAGRLKQRSDFAGLVQ